MKTKTVKCPRCGEMKKMSEVYTFHPTPYKRKNSPGSYKPVVRICKTCQHRSLALTRLRRYSVTKLHKLMIGHDRMITLIVEVLDEKKKNFSVYCTP